MIRRTVFLAVFVLFVAVCVPAVAGEAAADKPAADEGAVQTETQAFVFFGVATVREGKTVLFRNPDLSKTQVDTCTQALEGMLDLDRTFTTGTNKEGALEYTWGDDEGELTKAGLVPYEATFATPGEFIDVEEAKAEPCEMRMGFSTSAMTDCVIVSWWAPETTKACDISIEYYDNSSYKTVASLKGNTIAAGAAGTSPDGVSWKIVGVEEKENQVMVTVETSKGPEGHEFDFLTATKDFATPMKQSVWPEPTEDGKGMVYHVSFWAESAKEITSLEIRERHPDRIKKWAIKGFALKGK